MKKPTKRKMYLKRRKKEKANWRKSIKISPEITHVPPPKPTTYKYNNQQYQRNQNINFNPCNNHHEFQNPLSSYTHGLQLWWQTYCTAIQYHTQQQIGWNHSISHLQIPTTEGSNQTLLEKYAREYETSSEEEDDVEQMWEGYPSNIDGNIDIKTNDVDDEYLKFLEITHKHKEELRLKKAEENF